MAQKNIHPLGNSNQWVWFIIIFQILINITVQTDLPFVRQILGFIYLTTVPGYSILKAFKLSRENHYEIWVFSIGLSIALLMFIGLFLNWLFPILGLVEPLSATPLLIAINLVVLSSCMWSYIKNAESVICKNKMEKSFHSLLSIISIAIIFLGVAGTLVVNVYKNNSLLLLMIVIISGLIILGSFYKNFPRTKTSDIIIAVSIALIIPTALITNYLVGWDYHSEYHAYNLACKTKSWNPTFNCLDDRITKGYSSLSVTILPVIYSTILDIDGTWIFKILYPIVLSFIPLALYKLYYEKLGDKAAFLAIFFLLSNSVFFNVEIFSAKQIIGEFFYVLLFLVILKEKIGNLEKSFFFIVFSAALVMSHYSLAYIFLFCIFLTWFSTVMIKHTNLKAVKSRISLNMVILFFSIAFTWYIYTSASTLFNSILEIGDSISRNFITDFFNPSARTSTVLKGLGLAEAVSIWHQIGRTFFYISEFFIVIGMLRVIIKKEYGHFGYEYAILSFTNLTLLFMAIVIPNFAKYFRMERFYQISLLFLAPFFVLGGKSVFEIISKWRKRTKVLNLILLILIPFFLFETGFFYEVIGDYNYSLPLSMYRMNRIDLYRRIVDEKEVISSFWLLRNVNYSNSLVYSDSISSGHVLTSYAMLSAENMRELSNSVQFLGNKNYVYLREVNTIEEKIEGTENWYNFSDVAKTLLYQNLLYSNGDCEIFLITND